MVMGNWGTHFWISLGEIVSFCASKYIIYCGKFGSLPRKINIYSIPSQEFAYLLFPNRLLTCWWENVVLFEVFGNSILNSIIVLVTRSKQTYHCRVYPVDEWFMVHLEKIQTDWLARHWTSLTSKAIVLIDYCCNLFWTHSVQVISRASHFLSNEGVMGSYFLMKFSVFSFSFKVRMKYFLKLVFLSLIEIYNFRIIIFV